MVIDDPAAAAKLLGVVGYYRLSGYWYPYRRQLGPRTARRSIRRGHHLRDCRPAVRRRSTAQAARSRRDRARRDRAASHDRIHLGQAWRLRPLEPRATSTASSHAPTAGIEQVRRVADQSARRASSLVGGLRRALPAEVRRPTAGLGSHRDHGLRRHGTSLPRPQSRRPQRHRRDLDIVDQAGLGNGQRSATGCGCSTTSATSAHTIHGCGTGIWSTRSRHDTLASIPSSST